MTSKQGAYQKARRLKAEQVREPGQRRTPEVARDHEERAVAEDRAERALLLVQQRRFPVARHIGRLLLEHRDGIVLDSWAAYWLGEIAETIDDRDDPEKRARFTDWVESFVRAVHGHARVRNQPSATTEEARRALAPATEFTFRERPKIPEQIRRSSLGTRRGASDDEHAVGVRPADPAPCIPSPHEPHFVGTCVLNARRSSM
ncbi:hypothetical protein [Streptomyces sp. NPDC127197]|uniref:hypothetical protein n=1 Tax=Streptomyces sp. NPDC127197 TaxID=3345388 RepID=UPI00363DD3D3